MQSAWLGCSLHHVLHTSPALCVKRPARRPWLWLPAVAAAAPGMAGAGGPGPTPSRPLSRRAEPPRRATSARDAKRNFEKGLK